MKEEKKDFTDIHLDSIKARIGYLDPKDPGKQDLDALMKRIEYLESNNPNHVTLELVKQRISDNISVEVEKTSIKVRRNGTYL